MLPVVHAQIVFKFNIGTGFKPIRDQCDVLSTYLMHLPTTSPEGHALIAPDGTAVWLKVIHGIIVLDLVNVTITPEMIPDGEGHVKYRSANAARKTRVERKRGD